MSSVSLRAIARPTSGNQIVWFRRSTALDRHHMVHGVGSLIAVRALDPLVTDASLSRLVSLSAVVGSYRGFVLLALLAALYLSLMDYTALRATVAVNYQRHASALTRAEARSAHLTSLVSSCSAARITACAADCRTALFGPWLLRSLDHRAMALSSSLPRKRIIMSRYRSIAVPPSYAPGIGGGIHADTGCNGDGSWRATSGT